MSLAAALALLDQEIEDLQRQIDPKHPGRTDTQFCLLRAKSLGRSMLRKAGKMGLKELADVDTFYRGRRKALGLEDDAG